MRKVDMDGGMRQEYLESRSWSEYQSDVRVLVGAHRHVAYFIYLLEFSWFEIAFGDLVASAVLVGKSYSITGFQIMD
jgi:hypothetical protein